jgi:1-deoxy-D-xylulose-5-phosphate reductoisomerase
MDTEKKGLAILGSTGKLGKMSLQMLREHPNDYRIEVLTAKDNKELLIEQALVFKPNIVVIEDESLRAEIDQVLWEEDIKTYAGSDAIFQVAEMNEVQVVLNAIRGEAGIKPSMMGAISNKTLILGNSESLRESGEELFKEIVKRGLRLFSIEPIHSAIFQLLKGEEENKIEVLTLTATLSSIEIADIQSLFEIDNVQTITDSTNYLAEVQFEDGCTKTISGITEVQALANALFYPRRVKLK